MNNRFDLIILGSGIGGLSAAMTAAEAGLKVLIVNKSATFSESNTYYAQGGIVASGEGDSPTLLVNDIMRAGAGINNREAVELVAAEGPRLVEEILVRAAGVPFHQTATGEFDRTQEAAHSVRRILHVKDHTGASIEDALVAFVKKMPNVEVWTNHTGIDLITNTHHSLDAQQKYKKRKVLGAYILNNETNEVAAVFGAALILATGGVGNIYLHTSNPSGATGDGIAMASRAGCEIIHSEYMQFHPTVLFHRDVKRFLITEAMRGEGARLMNKKGEYFMDRYAPRELDLAPRDEVARAIYYEMGNEGGYVFLDATRITHVDVEKRFPAIYERCAGLGIDIRKDPIPVVPAAHYFCGGIKVGLDGNTEIEGLYAVGETACPGVHGANRLASVSLLEALVFGVRAARSIASGCTPISEDLIRSIPDWRSPRRSFDFDPVLIRSDMESLQTTMWNYVGILRTRSRLERALSDLNYLGHRIQRFYQEAKITREILELRNAILTSAIIAQASAKNPVSLGCHYVLENTPEPN